MLIGNTGVRINTQFAIVRMELLEPWELILIPRLKIIVTHCKSRRFDFPLLN